MKYSHLSGLMRSMLLLAALFLFSRLRLDSGPEMTMTAIICTVLAIHPGKKGARIEIAAVITHSRPRSPQREKRYIA